MNSRAYLIMIALAFGVTIASLRHTYAFTWVDSAQ
jgi:hypothetical protein